MVRLQLQLEDRRTSNTAESTRTVLNLEWGQYVVVIRTRYHNCTFHPNMKASPDPPSLRAILKAIHTGVGIGSGNKTTVGHRMPVITMV